MLASSTWPESNTVNRMSYYLSKEREFQSIFENALDAILVVDDKGVCQEANPSAWELFGSRRDRIVGQQVRVFYSDPHDFDSMWTLLLASHRYQGEAELDAIAMVRPSSRNSPLRPISSQTGIS